MKKAITFTLILIALTLSSVPAQARQDPVKPEQPDHNWLYWYDEVFPLNPHWHGVTNEPFVEIKKYATPYVDTVGYLVEEGVPVLIPGEIRQSGGKWYYIVVGEQEGFIRASQVDEIRAEEYEVLMAGFGGADSVVAKIVEDPTSEPTSVPSPTTVPAPTKEAEDVDNLDDIDLELLKEYVLFLVFLEALEVDYSLDSPYELVEKADGFDAHLAPVDGIELVFQYTWDGEVTQAQITVHEGTYAYENGAKLMLSLVSVFNETEELSDLIAFTTTVIESGHPVYKDGALYSLQNYLGEQSELVREFMIKF